MTDAEDQELQALLKRAKRVMNMSYALLLIVLGIAVHMLNPGLFDLGSKATPAAATVVEDEFNQIEKGIHVRTGLIDALGMQEVISNCTSCHSAKLVTQNRMTAERWNATIEWMQETQNLWDLGENKKIIVDYLVANYPPARSTGRRRMLTGIDWYELED